MNKEEFANYLMKKLSYAYCDNCENSNNFDNCEDCHRKYQNWALSINTAKEIAEVAFEGRGD